MVKLLLSSKEVIDLVVTYTVPEEYAPMEQDLAEDPEPWRHFPMFSPPYPEPSEKEPKTFLLGLGFQPLGLPELLEHGYHNIKVVLLFPFPPGPPNYQRTWEFVYQLENSLPSQKEIRRVNALDPSDAFDHILKATDTGKEYVIIAPYGPKPISLAMCIFAVIGSYPVYYTQPRIYNPRYSTGVQEIRGIKQVYAYCLRLGGRDIYSIGPV